MGLRYQTANIHLLVHLVDDVRLLGPLWTHSCFHFEGQEWISSKNIPRHSEYPISNYISSVHLKEASRTAKKISSRRRPNK